MSKPKSDVATNDVKDKSGEATPIALSDSDEDEDDAFSKAAQRYIKTSKIGEGTYAVVYSGSELLFPDALARCMRLCTDMIAALSRGQEDQNQARDQKDQSRQLQ